MDGVLVQGNTMFSLGAGSADDPLWPSKRHNVRIGRCDWLRIVDNSLFESGLDALVLTNTRNFTIRGNQIAWPGQRERGAAILIEDSPRARGTIVGNNFEYWTSAAVAFTASRLDNVAVDDNSFVWSATTQTWQGEGLLTDIDPVRLYAEDACTGDLIVRGFRVQEPVRDSIRGGASQSRSPLSSVGGVGSATRVLAIAEGEQSLFAVTDMAGDAGAAGGLVSLIARPTDGTVGVAHYLLFVSVAGSVCTVLESAGSTQGAGPSDPSFVWSCREGTLFVAPVGSSRGEFRFDGTGIGSLFLH